MELGHILIGALVTLSGVYLANRLNMERMKFQLSHDLKKHKEQLYRKNGEELYELVDKWLNGLFGYYMRRNAVMQEKISYNDCLDIDIKESGKNSVNFGRIEMLIDVYFPSVRSNYDSVIEWRAKLNKIESEFKRLYKDGSIEGERFLNPYLAAQISIEKSGDELKKRIIDQIKSL